MSENKKKLSKEEKIAKAKELLNEVEELELTKEDLAEVVGGINVDTDYNELAEAWNVIKNQ